MKSKHGTAEETERRFFPWKLPIEFTFGFRILSKSIVAYVGVEKPRIFGHRSFSAVSRSAIYATYFASRSESSPVL